ncbi:(2Fe-2S)-binding protein [Verminephrobacter eiseniae]|uniref:BFD domain protein (2Fe-2S)-binding domain protein n=1 Tax=Verminephrobacter eiseniae (strain EF01-2) TaxID=391735 RepID=A1WMF3_VEREI|nr:(2Fe-2S)-binding protein [Verminephrobacter eiseniae]ABM58810.1 BFD domain protein (2Fe-2S)-binding domain protein [Verminephrobacter eiseniae EF01-2]MCW5230877.1 ferredoxin [Verminephrobacter eiseniae]MCW5284378.1 ferredoxin [Verminephrobacter eiseniae]MCW5292610.1 ferredoxin [Verminephrobacter eiseniae]MCW5302084.1 ferredoxin [Verminephrobacter eiseniae]
MIVCVCRRISDHEIARHARAGLGFDEIQFELGLATQCGACENCARAVLAQCNASHPIVARHHQATVQTTPLASTDAQSKPWNSCLHSPAA